MKKLFVLLFVSIFLSVCSLSASLQQKTPKDSDNKKKVETTTKAKKVKTVKSVKKTASKCDDCKEKSTCTKKEKK